MKKLNLLLAIMIMAAVAVGQSVGINADGSAPDASAMLDVSSTTKGFLAPRVSLMSSTDVSTIESPATGLLIYNTANTGDVTPGYYFYSGSAWIKLDAGLWGYNLEDKIFTNYNVGIGTTSPSTQLELEISSSGTPTYNFFRAGNAGGDNLPQVQFSIENSAVNMFEIFGKTGLNSLASLMSFNLSNGNVGIGTTSPLSKLSVVGGAFTTNGGLTNTSSRPALGTSRIAGEIAGVGSSLGADDGFLRLSAGGGSSSSVKSFIDLSGYSTVTDMLANIVFGTEGTERMRINNAGNVGIGTTSPRYPLEVGPETAYDISGTYNNNYMRFSVNTAAGTAPEAATDGNGLHDASIFAQGSIMTAQHFKAISDKRVKENIAEIDNSLKLLGQLRPVTYRMKDQVKYGLKTHYGFIAQEVEKIIPEAVSTGIGDIPILKPFDQVDFEDGVEYTLIVKDGDIITEQKYTSAMQRPSGEIVVKSMTINDFKSLTYDMIFTLAVDAIQEQQNLIDDQQKQIDELQQKITELSKLFETALNK